MKQTRKYYNGKVKLKPIEKRTFRDRGKYYHSKYVNEEEEHIG